MHFPQELLRRCWFLAGPTAAGKSAAGVELALRLRGEIISLDSMALYRGLDVGTAKPGPELLERVPHHLIDLIEPHQDFSLAQYVRAAAAAAAEIAARDRTPLFVGGTGLYLRGVLRGVFEGPAANWAIRHRLERLAAAEGIETLHAELARVDPVLAARLPAQDVRRVIRALEVYELTGQPLSALQAQPPLAEGSRPALVAWLEPPRAWLYQRINERVAAMFARGLVDEVRGLLRGPRALSRTARQALGYKEVIAHLEGGPDLAATIDLVARRTRQFAKRQHTWYRNLEECRPVPISGQEAPAELADLLWRLGQQAP